MGGQYGPVILKEIVIEAIVFLGRISQVFEPMVQENLSTPVILEHQADRFDLTTQKHEKTHLYEASKITRFNGLLFFIKKFICCEKYGN